VRARVCARACVCVRARACEREGERQSECARVRVYVG